MIIAPEISATVPLSWTTEQNRHESRWCESGRAKGRKKGYDAGDGDTRKRINDKGEKGQGSTGGSLERGEHNRALYILGLTTFIIVYRPLAGHDEMTLCFLTCII